eukprot:gene23621-12959_t
MENTAALDFGSTASPFIDFALTPSVFGGGFEGGGDLASVAAQQQYQPAPTPAQVDARLRQHFSESALRLEPNEWKVCKASTLASAGIVLTSAQEERLSAMRRQYRSRIYAERTRQKVKVKHQEEYTQLQAELATAHAEIARLCRELQQWR